MDHVWSKLKVLIIHPGGGRPYAVTKKRKKRSSVILISYLLNDIKDTREREVIFWPLIVC